MRELKNVMERAVIMEDEGVLNLSSLPPDIRQKHSGEQNLPAFYLSSVERCHILKMLRYTNGNKTEAARLMNIGLATLYRKLEEYSIK